jgi:hypothetical protein
MFVVFTSSSSINSFVADASVLLNLTIPDPGSAIDVSV